MAANNVINAELLEAASAGRTHEVVRLIDAGANVDYQDRDGVTALIRASEQGHTETVEALLQAGADPNIQDDIGVTALDNAKNDDIKELIKHYIPGSGEMTKSAAKTGGDYYYKYLKYKTKYINLRDRQNR